jgi:hypothetical protein
MQLCSMRHVSSGMLLGIAISGKIPGTTLLLFRDNNMQLPKLPHRTFGKVLRMVGKQSSSAMTMGSTEASDTAEKLKSR